MFAKHIKINFMGYVVFIGTWWYNAMFEKCNSKLLQAKVRKIPNGLWKMQDSGSVFFFL
jgi:hypothetical protein